MTLTTIGLCLAFGLMLTCAFPGAAGAVAAEPADVLSTLHRRHPRLMVSDEDLRRVKAEVASNPVAAEYMAALTRGAEQILTEGSVKHDLSNARREMLHQSRTALRRITHCAGMYRLTGDVRYAERAREEMRVVCAFPDWNPPHFLDTAEMTTAVAIGYDWLYDVLPAEERDAIRTAIVDKGLKPGLEAFEKKVWWTTVHHNWAQVCQGGLTIGAVAIADEEPELARQVIGLARAAYHKPMAAFAPDGGCDEGPGYWNYATKYNVYYLAALDTALGTDFGFASAPGFAATGLFRMHTAGPTNKSFNYADAGEPLAPAPQMLWLARRFDRPEYAAHERRFIGNKPEMMHLLWFDGRGDEATLRDVPPDALFRGVDVVGFRSGWDAKALYVGLKGGDNKANHSHLDLGTFVIDAGGARWVTDLAGDNYALPGYFGTKRFTYYRLRTEGHNTLTFGGDNQTRDGKAPVIAFHSSPADAFAVVDLTDGYREQARSVRRGVRLLDRRHVLVQDEVELDEPAELEWAIHTPAAVEIDPSGRAATLRQGEEAFVARIVSDAPARFESKMVELTEPQKELKGVSKLSIRVAAPAGKTRITVAFGPDGGHDGDATLRSVATLDELIARGALQPEKR